MVNILELLQKCEDLDVLVLGDIVLDKYIEVEKFAHDVDPDTFGLEYVWQDQVNSIGASGIIARQSKEICCSVSCVGVVGSDMVGRELVESFNKQQIYLFNLTNRLNEGSQEVISPFRERIFRGPNRQVIKLMRNGYTGQSLLDLLKYSDSLSELLHELPQQPDVIFLCDFAQGLFTPNIVYQISHSPILRKKMVILKVRQWNEIYKVLPINLLFLDADYSWFKDNEDWHSILERELSIIAIKFANPIYVICNSGNRGCVLIYFSRDRQTGQNGITRLEYIEKPMNKVGLSSVITTLVGLLCSVEGKKSNDNFFDNAVSLILAIEQASRSWEFEVASRDLIQNWQIPDRKPITKIQPKAIRMIKILFLTANPSDTARLRLDEEIREIDRVLRQSKYRDLFEIEQQHAVRVTDLQRHLLRYKPDIVHFSGHGSEQNAIILENIHGDSQSVSVQSLGRLFSLLKDNIQCVVLNACYSENQAQAIAQYIDCVIGMSKTIGDKPAISFATAFYQALGYGKDVKTAFLLGCSQIDLENFDDEGTPKLLAKRADPGQIYFVQDDLEKNTPGTP